MLPNAEPATRHALDACSQVVAGVYEAVGRSVASVQVGDSPQAGRNRDPGAGGGNSAGSGVIVAPDLTGGVTTVSDATRMTRPGSDTCHPRRF